MKRIVLLIKGLSAIGLNVIYYYVFYLNIINFDNVYNSALKIFKKELIPQWFEGIGTILGAVLAAIGLYFAWKSLNKDLTEQNKRIESLVELTETMAGQADYLNKAIEVQNKILSQMISQGQHNEKMGELLVEQGKLELENRRLESKPDFKITDTYSNGVTYSAFITNIGKGDAESVNISFSEYDLEIIEIQPPSKDYERIALGYGVSFHIIHVARGRIGIGAQAGKVKITFSDIYGNKYENNYLISYRNLAFTYEKIT